MPLKKKCLVLALILVIAAPLLAEVGRFPVPSWKWSAPSDPRALDGVAQVPDFDDSAWAEVPAGATISPLPVNAVFWLRARLPAASLEALVSSGKEGGLYFLSGMAGCVFDAYVNGSYIGSHGRTVPRYDIRRTHSEAYLVGAGLLGGTGDVVVALRCTYHGSSFVLPHYELGDRQAASFETGAHNFWNGEFNTMLASLCAFLGLYFLALFVGKTQAKENLYFGVSLLLLASYFYEMGAQFLPFGGPFFTAFARGSLTASVLLLYCFFARFFSFKEKRFMNILAGVVAVLFYVAFLAAAKDELASNMVFNIGLLPIAGTLVFGIVAAISGVRRGQREAIPLLVGMAFGSYFAIHDIWYQVLGKVPFAWLQGLTFFLLDASIFVMLSMRQARLSRQLELLAGELEEGKNEIETSLLSLEKAGKAAADIGRELETAVSAAAASAEVSEGRTASLGSEAERLAARAGEADVLLSDFIASIDRVNQRLAEEAAGIERTAAAAVELQAGIESSSVSIDKTSEFATGLATLTEEGQKASAALSAAMERIAESARGIGEVVDAVNEFAERTNLLAMNASIEAAHSGASGKGFAVIAGEVKKLAAAQGEKGSRISELAHDIGTRLEEGGAEAERLRASLRRIAEDAQAAALRMAEARAGASEQAGASVEVRDAMETLAESVAAIRDEAERQAGYSAEVRNAVGAMVSGAQKARDSASAIATEGAEIARAVRNISALAKRSLSLTEDLKRGAGAS